MTSGSKAARMRYLRAQIERLRAELCAVEDGTMSYVEEVREGITAEGLANAAAISPQAANNRLRRLERVGILERDRAVIPGGGRYVYELMQ